MLDTYFAHLPGIGPGATAKLRDAGICCWRDALDAPELPRGRGLGTGFLEGVEESLHRLESRDAAWFSERLPASEQWRLFPCFHAGAAFVDIETTGLSRPEDHITTIALHDGKRLKTYVYGRDLEDFADDILEYALLVTWNGRCFDAPILRQALRIPLAHAHLDLLPVYRALGLRGGLKAVEKKLGLDRGDLDGVDGFMAVMLWREYRNTGNEKALETLLAYNAEDVLSLEFLARHACFLHGCPVETHAALPGNPHTADRTLVERLLRHSRPWYR